jgi:hypothetical protein
MEAIRNGLALLTWEQDSFAYADGYDDSAGRYRGLQFGPRGALAGNDPGLVVRSEVARRQMDAEATPSHTPGDGEPADDEEGTKSRGNTETLVPDPPLPPPKPLAKRYHGSVELDPTRVGKEASQVADEVISHLAGLLGVDVKLTLEIEAHMPDGAPEHVVRTVTENSRTLNFDDSGFESE